MPYLERQRVMSRMRELRRTYYVHHYLLVLNRDSGSSIFVMPEKRECILLRFAGTFFFFFSLFDRVEMLALTLVAPLFLLFRSLF